MNSQPIIEQFEQIHIDVTRNATDDFNLFHDSLRWSDIFQNPFQGPIVLGFQIESLIENKVLQHRNNNDELEFIKHHNLTFSNYQFSFAKAIKANEKITVDVKKTIISKGNNYSLSNRIIVKAGGKLALIGFKRETQSPLFLNESFQADKALGNKISESLDQYTDRSFLQINQDNYFLKRKYMNISNAKNFLCGSLVDQRLFFDELADKYDFPEIFPCSYISCALLEKSLYEHLDFEKNPMVYSSHKISIDRLLLAQLKSNQALNIIITQKKNIDNNAPVQLYECYGLVDNNAILFRAIVDLIPLAVILKSIKKQSEL